MLAGVLLVLMAGVMNGSFASPMKHLRGWEWENTWLAWAFIAMILMPSAVAFVTVPQLGAVYTESSVKLLTLIAVYGAFWGISAVFFGLGVARVGVSLTFGISLGIGAALGSLIPLLAMHRDKVATMGGALTVSGIVVVVAGVGASARAGFLREATSRNDSRAALIGLLICCLSGLGTAAMGVALNLAEPLYRLAEQLGASPIYSMNAIWPVFLSGAFLANLVYCTGRLLGRRTSGLFLKNLSTNIAIVALMAILWSGSNLVYGTSVAQLGSLGTVVGWPAYMAAIVLTANAWGLFSGEWNGATGCALRWSAYGSGVLLIGIALLGLASRYLG